MTDSPTIISRDEALAQEPPLKRFFTGVPCTHDHVAERRVKGGGCLECIKLRKDADYLKSDKAAKAKIKREQEQVIAQENSLRLGIQIISSVDARAQGLDKYFNGLPCKHGHVTKRFLSGYCVGCSEVTAKANTKKIQENLDKLGITLEIVTRAEAKNNGDDFYFTGKPCWRGHLVQRLVSTERCSKCDSDKKSRMEAKKQRLIDKAARIEAALSQGLNWYVPDNVCKKCNTARHYIVGDDCIYCSAASSSKRASAARLEFLKEGVTIHYEGEVVSCQSAKDQGLELFFTGEHCQKYHIAERHVVGQNCVICVEQGMAQSPEEVKKSQKESSQNWLAKNPGASAKSAAKWVKNNPEKHRAGLDRVNKNRRDERAADPEAARAKDRERRLVEGDRMRANANRRYKENPEPKLEAGREARRKDPEKFRKRDKAKRAKDPEKARKKEQEYREKNGDHIRATDNARYAKNPEQYYGPLGQIRAFWGYVRKRMNMEKGSRSIRVPYTPQEFQKHLVSTLPSGMSDGLTVREAHQKARDEKYQIDHIVPVSYLIKNFPYETACRMVVDLDNLRFIPERENIQKHSKMGEPYQLKVLDIMKERYL